MAPVTLSSAQAEATLKLPEVDRATCRKDYKTVNPDELGDLLPAKPGSIILVDFDETLWLRNSTEEFLKSVRPRMLAHAILKSLALLRPWRLVPDRASRPHCKDWMRVIAIAVCLPWSLVIWRRKAARLGPVHANRELMNLLRARESSSVFVITLGFRPVVAPLLSAVAGKDFNLIAAPLPTGMIWRSRGKHAAARARLTAGQLSGATAITDSAADVDLLCAVGNGLLCKWPGARYAPFGEQGKRNSPAID